MVEGTIHAKEVKVGSFTILAYRAMKKDSGLVLLAYVDDVLELSRL